jgi:hypothetical protein
LLPSKQHSKNAATDFAPKQPVWKVIVTPDRFYTLTYQPDPISAWVLHPQDKDRDRQTIETIIQSTLKKQPTNQIRTAS